MATHKKHIAVYLDPAVEQALTAFCERKVLKSKKGTMFSAGVNAALSEFFGISDIEESNTPKKVDNIPQEVGNILPMPVTHQLAQIIPYYPMPVTYHLKASL